MICDAADWFAATRARAKTTRAEMVSIHSGHCVRNGLNLPVNAWYNSRTLTRWRFVESCQPHS